VTVEYDREVSHTGIFKTPLASLSEFVDDPLIGEHDERPSLSLRSGNETRDRARQAKSAESPDGVGPALELRCGSGYYYHLWMLTRI
jgi:hypothetical protein